MKKQYQEPTVIVQKITPYNLICTSIRNITGIDDLGFDDEGTESAGVTTGNSRSSNLWDDEEDEY
jgi:hypothetical protein